jgi:hypothetical protein
MVYTTHLYPNFMVIFWKDYYCFGQITPKQSSFTSSFRFMSFISLLPSFRFNSSFLFVLLFVSFQLVHFIASVLSLQPFPSIRYFFSFVSKHLSRSFASSFRFKPFISFHHSFRFNLHIWCHCRLAKKIVAAGGCFFEFQLPRVLQQCYSF